MYDAFNQKIFKRCEESLYNINELGLDLQNKYAYAIISNGDLLVYEPF